MDSLVNYASEGENSNNSDDAKMSLAESLASRGRASDANYDPVQMDMSEESNNNNSSDESDNDRVNAPSNANAVRTEKPKSKSRSPLSDQRRTDHENHTTNSRSDERDGRRGRESSDRRHSSGGGSRRSSHDEGRGRRERDSRRSRDDERRSSRDERRDKANDDKDKDHHHRDERRDRDRDRGDRERRRERDRDRDRDRERERRSHFRDDRSQKDRHRDDRSSHHKEKDRARSRSRSRERGTAPFRPSSYREEKGRSKLAQLEKLGIELKAPENDAILTGVPGEQHFYNPLATATQGKYAEQIQKRKLLWANKNKQEDGKSTNATSTVNTWVGTTFTHDQDGKVSAKFKRLMGIKEDLPLPAPTGAKPEILKKQEEMFNNMEQQYEVARATTHTQRGVGLGYATSGYQFPR